MVSFSRSNKTKLICCLLAVCRSNTSYSGGGGQCSVRYVDCNNMKFVFRISLCCAVNFSWGAMDFSQIKARQCRDLAKYLANNSNRYKWQFL